MKGRQLILIVAVGMVSGWSMWAAAGQQRPAGGGPAAIPIDQDDIGGVVTSARGPEAGVWVIAETTDTPTKLRKIVVTDDRGRYLLPDLPAKATFSIWVRGYGLADSTPVRSLPGRTVALRATIAPDARTAARVYPANYWYSLIDIPAEKDFPGTGATGNGIATEMRTQHHWINQIKANCNVCHQMGNQATREIPKALGTFPSGVAAWDTRVQTGQDGQGMSNMVTGLGRQRGLEMFANWTDRITRGDIPPAPPRTEIRLHPRPGRARGRPRRHHHAAAYGEMLAPNATGPKRNAGDRHRRRARSASRRAACQLPSNTGFCFAAKAR